MARSLQAETVEPTNGGPAPMWPIPGYSYFSSTSFGGGRPSGCSHDDCERWHCGIDVHAPFGTVVVAMESGTVLVVQGWASKKGRPDRTSKALLLQLDSGPVIVYGGLLPDSWREFQVGPGAPVSSGQPLARVGYYPNGSTMLHIEGRKRGTRTATPWPVNTPPPANLRNLTPFLKLAKKTARPEWSKLWKAGDPDRQGGGAPPAPPAPPADDDEIVILDDEPITPPKKPTPAPYSQSSQEQWLPYADPEPMPTPPPGPGVLSKWGESLREALKEVGLW